MMKFLKSFFLTLRERFSKGESAQHPTVAVSGNEKLSRYIFSARHFTRQPPRVKTEAYMPIRGEVSVFRIDGLDQFAIWEIGSDIAKTRGRTLHGRGDTKAQDITKVGLYIMPDEPPPRHANLIGWPESDKPRQKLIALQIAAVATLMVLKE